MMREDANGPDAHLWQKTGKVAMGDEVDRSGGEGSCFEKRGHVSEVVI